MEHTHKPRVFLSSSIYGLEDLRSILIDLFEKKEGYSTVYYGDRCSGLLTGQPGIVEQCLNGVRSSNVFVLIVDRRYGGPNTKNEKGIPISMTELEYSEAARHRIPIFVFCREEVWIVHKFWETNPNMNFDADARYDHPTQLMSFLARLKDDGRYIPRFRDAAELKNTLSKTELSVGLLRRPPSLVEESQNLEASS
jgi:hypothetical protein